MATFNITVLSTSSTSNGYRFSGVDRNGAISGTNNETINVNANDTINFTFYNSSSHPFSLAGTSISGKSATGGYYSYPSYASHTFTTGGTYIYDCDVHGKINKSQCAPWGNE